MTGVALDADNEQALVEPGRRHVTSDGRRRFRGFVFGFQGGDS